MNPVTLSGFFHFFFWVVFPILFYWFGGEKKSNGQMCRGVIESDVAAGAVTRHRPGSAGRFSFVQNQAPEYFSLQFLCSLTWNLVPFCCTLIQGAGRCVRN